MFWLASSLLELAQNTENPEKYLSQRKLKLYGDEIEQIIKDVLSGNEKSVNDYKNGKANAITFLVGQVMRKSQGKANPAMVNEMLKKHLEE